MITTYINILLLQKGYPTLFWIASVGKASTLPAFSTVQLLKCSTVLTAKLRPSIGLHLNYTQTFLACLVPHRKTDGNSYLTMRTIAGYGYTYAVILFILKGAFSWQG